MKCGYDDIIKELDRLTKTVGQSGMTDWDKTLAGRRLVTLRKILKLSRKENTRDWQTYYPNSGWILQLLPNTIYEWSGKYPSRF